MPEYNVTTGIAVVGGQFGSEAKGHAVQALVYGPGPTPDVHVRTGGPNAGHTIWHRGFEWKMRQVPCGWIDPQAELIIGPGAVLDVDLLVAEVMNLQQAGYYVLDRLHVDSRATVILSDHQQMEGHTGGYAHQQIGSTGEGVGAARMARIGRGVLMPRDLPFQAAGETQLLQDMGVVVEDVTDFYWGRRVLLEGTQGFGLSLTLGEWPYVTSADTTAAQLCADAGFPVTDCGEVVLVVRCYPIRVAGNSGRLPHETSWEALGLPEERTTVTQKVRRVAEFDLELVVQAAANNGATSLVLTGIDQRFPEAKGMLYWHELPEAAREWVQQLESQVGVPIYYVGTGPASGCWAGE